MQSRRGRKEPRVMVVGIPLRILAILARDEMGLWTIQQHDSRRSRAALWAAWRRRYTAFSGGRRELRSQNLEEGLCESLRSWREKRGSGPAESYLSQSRRARHSQNLEELLGESWRSWREKGLWACTTITLAEPQRTRRTACLPEASFLGESWRSWREKE